MVSYIDELYNFSIYENYETIKVNAKKYLKQVKSITLYDKERNELQQKLKLANSLYNEAEMFKKILNICEDSELKAFINSKLYDIIEKLNVHLFEIAKLTALLSYDDVEGTELALIPELIEIVAINGKGKTLCHFYVNNYESFVNSMKLLTDVSCMFTEAEYDKLLKYLWLRNALKTSGYNIPFSKGDILLTIGTIK